MCRRAATYFHMAGGVWRNRACDCQFRASSSCKHSFTILGTFQCHSSLSRVQGRGQPRYCGNVCSGQRHATRRTLQSTWPRLNCIKHVRLALECHLALLTPRQCKTVATTQVRCFDVSIHARNASTFASEISDSLSRCVGGIVWEGCVENTCRAASIGP